jgi:chemotaxis methyl-accepting protein methylase
MSTGTEEPMSEIDREALGEVARLVHRESGIDLKAAQFGALTSAIARIEPGLTAAALLQRASSQETLRRLIDEVTIRETFFFRHPAELEAIDWHALLRSARGRGAEAVRVWVAGCASGEEAYTVAILACEAFSKHSTPVEILASDIAPSALQQTKQGSYRERAARNLTPMIRERYFTETGGLVKVGSRLRSLVRVLPHNLVREAIPPLGEHRFDVILCRNVLIYFDRPTVERVIGGLEGALTPDGLLLLGAADRLSGQNVMAPKPSRPPRARLHPLAQLAPRTPQATQAGSGQTHRRPVHEPSSEGALAATPQDPCGALERALKAADRGELETALSATRDALKADPLNAEAYVLQGVTELAREHARAAVEPLRRALYIDPNHSHAAFNLARAHDALDEAQVARRAYERTLRTLDHEAQRHTQPSERLERLDIAAACHARLRELL